MNCPDPDDLRNDDALWRLLGRARPVPAAPFFARRVSRAIETPEPAPWWTAWRRLWLPTAACAGLALMAVVAMPGAAPPATLALTLEQEFETIATLDLLVASSESSPWIDSSSLR